MLTDPKLRSQVDALWDKFWTGGLSNPLDAIEQFSYLLFLKRLDDRENAAERQAKRRGGVGGAAPLRPYVTPEHVFAPRTSHYALRTYCPIWG